MRFNFQQRVSKNMDMLRVWIACLASYGLTVHDDSQALVILAEVDMMARADRGR